VSTPRRRRATATICRSRSAATHLLEVGYDIRTIRESLGHKDVKTTTGYTHVLNRRGRAVQSPMDGPKAGRSGDVRLTGGAV
jgi:integrase